MNRKIVLLIETCLIQGADDDRKERRKRKKKKAACLERKQSSVDSREL